MKSAVVFDIEKMAVHDGPGIRTVVFLKGCPLHCIWCHNPESRSFEPELFFDEGKCTCCRQCAAVCPRNCHEFPDGKHIFNRKNCLHCGICTEKCAADALELVGKLMTVAEVMDEVVKDRVFYEHSGGGITLSGGEPLSHFDFTRELLTVSKKEGLHTCVETSGFAPWGQIEALLPLVDLWLWDVKALPHDHARLTGVPSECILANLHRLDAAGGQTVLRCPLIPGVNDSEEELLRIAALSGELKHVREIDLEPYHPLGESKNAKLGNNESFQADFVSPEIKIRWRKIIERHTKVKVVD